MLNAVVADRFDAARAEADACDQCAARGDRLPDLAGVPFTVKEMIDTAGMPSTFGCTTRRHRVASTDATIVQRLRKAGAIPIAATNIPEWGLWFETDNLVYGRTNNPHNLAHTTGGSSGGEAAIIAAGGAPFGVGSDIGGSIRIPAAFCGVFGHKPSNGLVPLTGHYPVYGNSAGAAASRENPWVVLGPLARSARDLGPLLRIIAEPDGIDPNCEPMPLDHDDVSFANRKVWLLEEPHIKWAGRTRPDLAACVQRAGAALAERGAQLREFPAALFRDTVELWFAALQSLGAPLLKELVAEGGSISINAELGRTLLRTPRFSLPVLGFCLVEGWSRKSSQQLERARLETEQLQRRFAELLDHHAILLMPAHPRPAPRHHHALLFPFSFAYTAIMNVLRAPATVAPMGTDAAGLPLSIQIAATRGQDLLTIAAAHLLEDAFGGWIRTAGRARSR